MGGKNQVWIADLEMVRKIFYRVFNISSKMSGFILTVLGYGSKAEFKEFKPQQDAVQTWLVQLEI